MFAINSAGTRPAQSLRGIVAASVGALLVLSSLGVPAAPAAAAVGDTYRIQNPNADAGTSIRFLGSSSNKVTRLWQLAGQSGAASRQSYSIDFSGVSPTTNNNYTQADWETSSPPYSATALSDEAKANRGRVEWILKNSYPTVSVLNTLRDRIRATPGFSNFPSSNWTSNLSTEAIAGTQAAIWHLTDGVELDLTNTNPNNDRIKILYQYLLAESEDAVASTAAAPTVELVAETDRDPYSIEAGTAFGPFTLESSANATLSVSGPAVLVNEQGNTITGTQTPGTRFWVKPTASPAAPGSVTVTATTVNVTTEVVNAAFGQQHVTPFAEREALAVLSSSTQNASTTLTTSWVIDQSSPSSFDASGSASEREFVYNQRGELSATLEKINFTDGTSTTTDAIGLTGVGGAQTLDAYSADYSKTAVNASQGPNFADQTRFTEKNWNDATKLAENDGQEAVARILSDSYPNINLSALTTALKDAGYLAQSSGNIKSWEAYAGTQAAIWNFTDDKQLDTTRYANPTAVTASSTASGFDAANVLNADASSGWRANAAGEAYLDFTFPAAFEPRSYAVTSLEGGAQANTPSDWRLYRSFDGGVTFQPVSVSSVTHSFAGGAAETRVSSNIPPGASYGAWTSTLRLVFTGAADSAQPVEIGGVSFEGFGVFGSQPTETYAQYANATNVVQLYKYLLERAETDPILNPEPVADITGETEVLRETGDELIGPFTLDASLVSGGALSARVSVHGHSAGAGLVTDPTAQPSDFLDLGDGDQFYFKAVDGEAGTVSLSAQSSAQNWVTARALDGVKQGVQGPVLTALGVQTRIATAELEVAFDVLPAPALELDQISAYAGQRVEVTGAGFRPGEEVSLELHSTPIPLTTVVASASGEVQATVTVPAAAEVGPNHHVVALGTASARTAQTALEVLAVPANGTTPVGPVQQDGDEVIEVVDEVAPVEPGPEEIPLTGGTNPLALLPLALLLLCGGVIAVGARLRSNAYASKR